MSTLCLVISACVLAGCGEKSSTSTGDTRSDNPVTAPLDYLGAAGKAKQSAEKTLDTVSLNQAVQQFYAAEGRFPTELKELVTTGYLREIPTPPYGKKIFYDSSTGQVKIVNQ